MKIMYDSLTKNVARFVKKLGLAATQITSEMVVEEGFVLVTFTTGLGQIPDTTQVFLRANGKYLRGVASSGNRNFGTYYALAADEVAKFYDVPIISKFELSGTPTDVAAFLKGLSEIEAY